MTTDEFIAIRKEMGLNHFQLAVALGLKGVQAIESIERGGNITGPMALAMQKIHGDWKASSVNLPNFDG